MREHLRYLSTNEVKYAFDKDSGLLHIDHATACLNIIRWFATQKDEIQKRLDKEESKRDKKI